MSNATNTGVVAVAAIGIAAGLLWWRSQQDSGQAVTAAPPAALPAPVPAPPASEPAIKFPVETAAAPLTVRDLPEAFAGLLGRTAVSSFLQLDDFPRRFVATVDNLGRAHAPPLSWPVNPTAGRFTVQDGEGGAVISADNSARYTPFVLLAERVDATRAVELYRRMYPMLQQAYRDIGFPNRYFNDRLIEVIDLLLATPEPGAPPAVRLTEVKGPIPSVRPWVRYEFADPALESLTAGQKILVRVGSVNERRLKARLADIRQQLTRSPPGR